MAPRIPDAKVLVNDFLRSRSEVSELVGDRVGTRTPEDTDLPWVRTLQIGDAPKGPFLHLITVHLQFDCYGSADRFKAEGEASLLARTVREALAELSRAELEGAVVSAVTFGSMPDVPADKDLDPPRHRQPVEASITLHPA